MALEDLIWTVWQSVSPYVVELLVMVIATLSTYYYLRKSAISKKLEWAPEVPGIPILGCIMELGQSTEILNVFSSYCDRFNGLCRMNLFGKPFILVSDYNFMAYLLKSNVVLDKNDSYKFLKNWLGTGMLTAGAPKWRKTRKMLNPSFNTALLEQFMEVFEKNAKILVDLMKEEVKRPSVDVFTYMTMCSLDNICESAMGVSINAQTNRQSDYVSAVKGMCRITVDRSFSAIKMYDILYRFTFDYFREKKYVKTLHDKTHSVILARHTELMRKMSEEKSEEDEEREDIGAKKRVAFLDLLLQARVSGIPLSDDDIRQEVDTVMFAGHDTTSSALSFIIYCLATYPEHQEKVVDELNTIFGDDKDRPITTRDLQNMKYLEMVINETLRLFPPVPFTGRKVHGDVMYEGGKVLPDGLSLILYIYGAMRNPTYFPDPEKFDPLRFEEGQRLSPYAFIPFSAGPRNCIGQKFAMMEMKITIAKLLQKYEFVSCNHQLILAAETLLISKNGVRVTLKLRN